MGSQSCGRKSFCTRDGLVGQTSVAPAPYNPAPDASALYKALPKPDGKGKPGKMTSFAPGIDDQGKPFPLRQAPPPEPKK